MLAEETKLPSEDKDNIEQLSNQTSETSQEELKATEQTSETLQEASPETVEKPLKEKDAEAVAVEKEAVVEEPKTEVISKEKNAESNKAVDEIESKIAESSEATEHSPAEVIDYNNHSIEELVEELGKLVKEDNILSISNNVNKIKNVFNLKFGQILKKEKEKFLSEGGNVIDFQYSNPLKSTYNSYLYDFKQKRTEFFKNQENKLKDNLQKKLEVIEELKHLIDNADGATMYKMFKTIQEKWNSVGPIPRAKYNDTWRTYHHHVERFYDLLHLSNDLRDLDFKHNLEEKLKLVEKAEELAEMEDINAAFKELQVLHKLWKEDIGPVAREDRELIWDRFSEATKKVHDKRHEFFKDLKSKFEGNIDLKLEVIDAINSIDTSNNKTRSDWQKSIKQVEELRKKFFNIGQVPRAKSDQIWNKFKDATKKFNVEKNRFFKDVKKDHLDNLNKKKTLIEQAVALKDSEDWENTTELMKKIQSDWKKIGHVPRKYSDKIWKEFKDACNHYFDRLHDKQDEGNKEQIEVLKQKKDILNSIKDSLEKKVEISIDDLKEYVKNWRELGRVPYEMRHIEVKFNKLLDKVVENNSIDKQDVEMIKFENLVNSYLEQKNYRKLDSEQLFIRKKIDETIKEIQQLDNNVGFISNVNEDNPFVKKVREQIAVYQEKLDVWKAKLDYLKNIE
jgi:hypothetical protein